MPRGHDGQLAKSVREPPWNSPSNLGPYRDEDVLSLQLLEYLSKYPHVCHAFYKPRVIFHPASVSKVRVRYSSPPKCRAFNREWEKEKERVLSTSVKETF